MFREVLEYVLRVLGREFLIWKVIVGINMFVYEFGIYVDGVIKDFKNYEVFDLVIVGFER